MAFLKKMKRFQLIHRLEKAALRSKQLSTSTFREIINMFFRCCCYVNIGKIEMETQIRKSIIIIEINVIRKGVVTISNIP